MLETPKLNGCKLKVISHNNYDWTPFWQPCSWMLRSLPGPHPSWRCPASQSQHLCRSKRSSRYKLPELWAVRWLWGSLSWEVKVKHSWCNHHHWQLNRVLLRSSKSWGILPWISQVFLHQWFQYLWSLTKYLDEHRDHHLPLLIPWFPPLHSCSRPHHRWPRQHRGFSKTLPGSDPWVRVGYPLIKDEPRSKKIFVGDTLHQP